MKMPLSVRYKTFDQYLSEYSHRKGSQLPDEREREKAFECRNAQSGLGNE